MSRTRVRHDLLAGLAALSVLLALHGAPLVFANADTRGSAQQDPDAPPAKKVIDAEEKQIHDREVALGPPAPAKAGPATVDSSCPTVVIPGPVEAFNPGEAPFLGGKKLTTQVVVTRGGAGYVIFAGAADEDARQGIIVVHRLAGDLCAHPGDSGTFSTFMDSTGTERSLEPEVGGRSHRHLHPCIGPRRHL